jgi:hypothetical protein
MFSYNEFDIEKCNISELSQMYRHCFNQDVSSDYFLWKYVNNPAGEVVAYDAKHEQALAGFYGVIPEVFVIDGKHKTVFQSMDTMTHPNYQKKGLFVTLANQTISKIFEENQNTFLFGIPGSNSFHGFVNKLQWKLLHSFSYIFINRFIYNFFNLFKRKSKFRIHIIDDFSSREILDFFEEFHSKSKIAQSITPLFLQWKISKNPRKVYHSIALTNDLGVIAAVIIYTLDVSGKCFIDLVCVKNDSDYKPALLAMCDSIFERHPHTKYIYTWSPLNINYKNALSSIGFIRNPFKRGPFSYKIPFIVYSKKYSMDNIDVLDIKNYDLQPIVQD